MAQYRTLKMDFWSDTYIERLPVFAKLLYLYLISSEHTDNLGVLTITRRKIAYETGLPEQEIDKIIAGFVKDGKVFQDRESILLINFIKNQTSTSKLVISGLQALFDQLEIQSFRRVLLSKYQFLKGSDMDSSPIEQQVYGSIPSQTISDHIKGYSEVQIPCLEVEYEVEVEKEVEREFEYEVEKEVEEEKGKDLSPAGADSSATPPTKAGQVKKSSDKSDHIPYERIKDLYAEICAPKSFSKIRELTDKRRKSIHAAWTKSKERSNLEWWTKYFELLASSPFLNGSSGERGNWVPDFDFVLRPDVIVKAFEGKYHRGKIDFSRGKNPQSVKDYAKSVTDAILRGESSSRTEFIDVEVDAHGSGP